jgi:hypothetical protein
MKYARIQDGYVVEICIPIDGFSIEQCFHADLVDKMVACSDSVQPGWQYKAETGQFSEDGNFPDISDPALPETPPEEPSA